MNISPPDLPQPAGNCLIHALPPPEREGILALCKPVNVTFGDILCEAHQPLTHIVFPLTGIISMVSAVKGHPAMELGITGSEGVFGSTIALGIHRSPLRAVIQGSGSTLQIETTAFQKAVLTYPQLARKINNYLYVLISQMSLTISCTQFHPVELRLARWLLMTHDRSHADHFHLTHQFLADMLGVQRSAITIAAGALQKRKLISYSRGEISVLSRDGLEAASCECYAASVRTYKDIFTIKTRG